MIDGRGPEEGGAAYGPYQIPRYTRRDGGAIHLFYTLCHLGIRIKRC